MAMDLFKRSQSQARSRQSSLDAQMPAPESMVPPGSSSSSHSSPLMGLHSPPDRRNRDSASFRRSSVFTLRPRSNTSNSMNSKLSVADEPDRRSSREISPHSASASVSEPPGHHKHKSSMFASRGKKLRRQSSKLSMTIDDWEAANQGRRSSLFGKERKKSTYETVEQYNLRMRHISNPFDFQHLTHSHPKQFERALESNRQDELVAEFWAHRASQARNKELRGIKVEDLSPGPPEDPRPMSNSYFTVTSPPNVSPKTSRDKHHSPSPTSNPQAVRHTRSLGSFSYPIAPNSGEPMPRTSSRLAMATGTDPSRRSSGLWSEAYNHASMPGAATDEQPHGPHAFTTPDDTAIPVASPNWGTDLEHIAEEEEGYFARRPHEKSVLHSPSPDLSPTHQPEDESEQPPSDLPLRTETLGPHEQLKSFAQSRLSARTGGARPRPLSAMSDTLGAPFHPAQKSPGPRASPALQRASSIRRRSTFFKSLDNNTWEDDIDFCYDVGADADCEFDWERMSNGPASARSFTPMEPSFQHRRTTSTVEEEPEEDNEETIQSLGNFRPSLVVPSTTSIPDLDYPSAISASTNSLLTPVDSYAASTYAASTNSARNNTSTPASDRQEPYNPNLLVPHELKEQVSKESIFDEMLDSYAQRGGPDDDSASDRHYPLLSNSNRRSANTLSIAESSRSGPSRYSMGSSYDSSLRSASISLTSPPRRSRSSIGSVPELVHSRRARRTIELNVDRLSKDLARFAHEENEEEEQAAEKSTFFANSNDENENENERTAEDDDADDEASSLRHRHHHHARPASSSRSSSRRQSSRSRPTSLLAPAPPPAKPVPAPPGQSSRSLPPSRSSSFRHPKQQVAPPNPRHTLHHMPQKSTMMSLPQQQLQHERTLSADGDATKLLAQAGARAQHSRVSSLGVGPAGVASSGSSSSPSGRKASVTSKTYTLSLFPTPPKATR
ncbi:hypothetical protein IWZ01DRAFT_27668 [Phyllosticta capitalensis]